MSDFSDWVQQEMAERVSTISIETYGSFLVKANNAFSKDYVPLAQGDAGQILMSAGASALPTWDDPSALNFGFTEGSVVFINATGQLAEDNVNFFWDDTDNTLQIPALQFDTTAANGAAEGRLVWNDDDGTLNLGLKGGVVNLQVGQEIVIRGKNVTGTATTNGLPARVSGASGSKPEFNFPDADDPALAGSIGLFTEDININANGYVTVFGLVRDVDTTGPGAETWNAGDRLFISNTPGVLTNIYPTGVSRVIFIGIVLRAHITEGIIWVNPINTPYLPELSGVTISSVADNELLAYDSGTGTWINQTPNEAGLDALYLNLDGESTNVTNGSFSLTTTGDGTFNNIAVNQLSANDNLNIVVATDLYMDANDILDVNDIKVEYGDITIAVGGSLYTNLIQSVNGTEIVFYDDIKFFDGQLDMNGNSIVNTFSLSVDSVGTDTTGFVTFGNTIIMGGQNITQVGTVNTSQLDSVYAAGIEVLDAFDMSNNSISAVSYLNLTEQSADPSNPAEGDINIWQSDGTGFGDDGDLVAEMQAGAVTKTATLIDFNILGTTNTAHGLNALSSIEAGGTNNVAIGYEAAQALTTGDNNIAIGYQALYTSVAGGKNIAIGDKALYTSLAGNTLAIGYYALLNSTGANNVALGNYTLESNTTGSYGVAIGYAALQANNGDYNVGIGYSALRNNTTGIYNVALGIQALEDNEDGDYNLAIGAYALRRNTTGYSNVAFGFSALYINTTGYRNVGIGANALYSCTDGRNNMAIGYAALRYTTDGDLNTAIGTSALQTNTTGSYNTAIGVNALRDATTSNNMAIGFDTLKVDTSGFGNVAVGGASMMLHTTGHYNTTLGFSVLSNSTEGGRNTVVGYNSGDGITTGSYNTIVGANVTGLNAALTGYVIIADGYGNHRVVVDNSGNIMLGDGGVTDYANISVTGVMTFEGAGGLVIDKASGTGIKVDNAAPTFGFADLLGEVFARNTGSNKPIRAAWKGGTFGFQFGVDDNEEFEFHIPHDYVKGTPIFLHLHWGHNATTVTGGTITFDYEMTYAKGHGQSSFGNNAIGTIVSATATTTRYSHDITEAQVSTSGGSGTQIDTDQLEPDGVIKMTAGVNANNLTVSSGGAPDIFMHYIDIHYQTTGMIGTKGKAPDFYA